MQQKTPYTLRLRRSAKFMLLSITTIFLVVILLMLLRLLSEFMMGFGLFFLVWTFFAIAMSVRFLRGPVAIVVLDAETFAFTNWFGKTEKFSFKSLRSIQLSGAVLRFQIDQKDVYSFPAFDGFYQFVHDAKAVNPSLVTDGI